MTYCVTRRHGRVQEVELTVFTSSFLCLWTFVGSLHGSETHMLRIDSVPFRYPIDCRRYEGVRSTDPDTVPRRVGVPEVQLCNVEPHNSALCFVLWPVFDGVPARTNREQWGKLQGVDTLQKGMHAQSMVQRTRCDSTSCEEGITLITIEWGAGGPGAWSMLWSASQLVGPCQ